MVKYTEEDTFEPPSQQTYQYKGCITSFRENGDSQMIVPSIDNDTMIERDDSEYSQRLVARQLLLTEMEGNGNGQISCTPTTISFVPKVVIPDGKDKVILRASCYVDGHSVLGGATEYIDIMIQRSDINIHNTDVAIVIAQDLFVQEGKGLMSQYDIATHFDSILSVSLDGAIPPITISGHASTDTPPDYLTPVKESSVLTLKVLDDLPADAVDFVKEQWGHDVTVHSCLSTYNMGK